MSQSLSTLYYQFDNIVSNLKSDLMDLVQILAAAAAFWLRANLKASKGLTTAALKLVETSH